MKKISEKKAKQLRSKVLAFAAQILEITASQAEMPEPKNDDEDEWMRDELTNIAADLREDAYLP